MSLFGHLRVFPAKNFFKVQTSAAVVWSLCMESQQLLGRAASVLVWGSETAEAL